MNPPGSMFKLVVTAAALESAAATRPRATFPNPPTLTLPGTDAVDHATRAAARAAAAPTVTLADGPAAVVQHPVRRARHGARRRRHPRAGREVRLQQRVRDPHRDRARAPTRAASTSRRPRSARSARATCGRRRCRWRWCRPRSRTAASLMNPNLVDADHGARLSVRCRSSSRAEYGSAISAADGERP